MAIIQDFEDPATGAVHKDAYWRVILGGPISSPAVSLDVYTSEQAAKDGKEPLTKVAFQVGRCPIDVEKPTGPQVYAVVKARYPDAKDA